MCFSEYAYSYCRKNYPTQTPRSLSPKTWMKFSSGRGTKTREPQGQNVGLEKTEIDLLVLRKSHRRHENARIPKANRLNLKTRELTSCLTYSSPCQLLSAPVNSLQRCPPCQLSFLGDGGRRRLALFDDTPEGNTASAPII